MPPVFLRPLTTLTKLAGRDKITFGVRAIDANSAAGKSEGRSGVRWFAKRRRWAESCAEAEDFLPARFPEHRRHRNSGRGAGAADGSGEVRRHPRMPAQGRAAAREIERI